jgi:hypothetical protein
MNSRTLVLAALVAALVLTACGPAAGQEVIVKSGAEGCKIFDSGHGEWIQCSDLAESTAGVTVDKEGYAHNYAGRVRVQFEYEGYPGIYVYRWFLPADVKTP